MKLTREEYEALIKRRSRRNKARQESSGPPESQPRAHVQARGKTALGPSGMNKTEQRYLEEVLWPRVEKRDVLWYAFDSFRLRLSVEGEICWYKPDYAVMLYDGHMQFHEIKGAYIREDARIKFQCAMKQYPMYAWLLWQWNEGKWNLIKDSSRLERVALLQGGPCDAI